MADSPHLRHQGRNRGPRKSARARNLTCWSPIIRASSISSRCSPTCPATPASSPKRNSSKFPWSAMRWCRTAMSSSIARAAAARFGARWKRPAPINYPICIFAEGHRHNDGHVHEFEEGAAWLATMSKLPCVPMAISGSGAFFPRKAKVPVPGRYHEDDPASAIMHRPRIARARSRSLTLRIQEAVRSAFLPEL